MSYTAVPTDEEGFPMIPDHMSFIDAVYWYVNMKIRYLQMATEGTRIAQTLFQHAESKWRFYVRQAYGKAMMPSGVGQFEALKNQWLRLMPTPNEAETFFQYLNTKEELKY